ncbi:MAG: methyl-accepting chemotaxis protein [Bacillota bacterium]
MSSQNQENTSSVKKALSTFKKETEKKRVSISSIMIKRLAAVTLCVNLLLLVVVGTIADNFIKTNEEHYLDEIVSNIASTIDTTLHEYVSVSDIIVVNPSIIELMELSDKQNPMQDQEIVGSALDFITAIQKQLPDIMNIGLCSMEQNAFILQDGSISPDTWDFPSRPFYSVVTTQKSMITTPYIDGITGELVVTMASPIINEKGTSVGGIFVDLSLDFVTNLINSSRFGETGESFIVDSDGNLVACTNPSLVGENYSAMSISGADLASEMNAPTGTLIDLDVANVDKVGKIGKIGNTGWTLVTMMNQDEYDSDINFLNSILVLMLIISIVITLIVAVLTVKVSVKPLSYIREAMNELSKGNISFPLTYQSDNEIGELADDFRATTANLSNYISEITRLLKACGHGDFTLESDMEFVGDFAEIQHSISDFTTLISSALNDMKETIEQVSLGSTQVATTSQGLASGANQQAESVQILQESVKSITNNIANNVKNVHHVNEYSTKTATELRIANEKMDEMVDSMREIARASDGIQKIVKTIEDVAFQTNILALNAAVEAARAGVAGKGFAVVAEEVRNLSSRTSQAVQETSRLIEESVASVNVGDSIVNATAESLSSVIELVDSFTDSLTDITNTSREQEESIQEVNHGIDAISVVTQSNSAISEESAATSEELSSQADVMKDTIDQFKTL